MWHAIESNRIETFLVISLSFCRSLKFCGGCLDYRRDTRSSKAMLLLGPRKLLHIVNKKLQTIESQNAINKVKLTVQLAKILIFN